MLARRIGAPLAGLALATAVLVVPVTSGALVTTTTTTSTGWGTWQSQALSAVARYRGDGPLTAGQPGPILTSDVATPDGPLSVAERTVVAEDAGGQVLVQMTVLGGTQVLVTETDPTAGNQGATLVLEPGSSTVAHTYERPGGARPPATTTAERGAGHRASTDAVVRHVGPVGHHRARLTTTGGCYPTPQRPFVATTTFGPLVDGEGIIDCSRTENLSLIVSIYRGLITHVGTTASNSTPNPRLSFNLNSYYFCTHITGTHDFRTSQIWAVNGTDEGGATSSEAALHCT